MEVFGEGVGGGGVVVELGEKNGEDFSGDATVEAVIDLGAFPGGEGGWVGLIGFNDPHLAHSFEPRERDVLRQYLPVQKLVQG